MKAINNKACCGMI